MITQLQLAQYKIAVIGLGLTGISCARFLQLHKIDFGLFDTRSDSALLAQIPAELADVEAVLGLNSPQQLAAFDALIVSPGISLKQPVVAEALAQGKVLLSDIDLLNIYCSAPIVAITGTNGKSTVTSLTAEMLRAAGKSVLLGGNIGIPVLDALTRSGSKTIDYCVLELSSFQLERCQTLAAASSTVLNISEDHLDRYDGLQDYIDTKAEIYRASQNIAFNLDDPAISLSQLETYRQDRSEDSVAGDSANVTGFSLSDKTADFYYSDGVVYHDKQVLFSSDELCLKGLHNIANVMAALALVSPLLDDLTAAIDAAKNYTGLAHRCQFVAKVQGIDYINDSKATNEGSTIAAIEGLLPTIDGDLHLVLGGEDKGALFEQLAQYRNHQRIRFYLFGRCKDKLAALLALDTDACYADLSSLVEACSEEAKTGDLVLFSPACASFDMFDNFEHRGEVFTALVKQLEVRDGV